MGRRDTNDVVLAADDERASSDHCELRFQAGTWILADRASTNGTYVDGAEIKGDVLVRTGLLVELGEGGPVVMVDLPDDEPALAGGKPVPIAPAAGPNATVLADGRSAASPAPQTSGASSEAAAFAAAGGGGGPGPGPSTGRTSYYMAIMTDKVQKSSKKLKIMIGLLTLLLVGVATFGVIMAVKVEKGEENQAALAEELKSTGEKLEKTDQALDETKAALEEAQGRMKKARNKLAKTSGKLATLRLAIKKAQGDAKLELQAQATKLEKTRQEYEKKLKSQEQTLAKLSKDSAGGEKIAKDFSSALYMLIAPTPKGEFGFCTAFAIHTSGVLATNSHCLRTIRSLNTVGKAALARMNRNPSKTYRVVRWRGHPKHARLLSEDVALLWLDTAGGTLPVATKLAAVDKVKTGLGPGMPIYTMGFPGKVMNERQPAADFRAAVISRLTDFANGPGTEKTARVVWHSALTSKGTSGSPIFDRDGEVIAVNTGGLGARSVEVLDKSTGKKVKQVVYDATGLNFGVRIDALREIMGPAPPAPKAAAPAPTTAPNTAGAAPTMPAQCQRYKSCLDALSVLTPASKQTYDKAWAALQASIKAGKTPLATQACQQGLAAMAKVPNAPAACK